MNKKEKKFYDFLEIVSRLEAVEYCGLCKILCVKIEDKNKEPRSFEDTFEEVMEKFLDMKKKPQRQLMKMLKTLRSGKDGASS